MTAGAVRHPDTTPPPGTLTAPSDGSTVGGAAVPLSVTSTAAVAKVEFTVDGDPVVTSTSTSSPYTATWDSTSVVDGTHYVAARITDTQGRVNTTNVAAVNVNTPAQPGATFGLDGSTSVDGRGTQTTPTLTGLHGGDVLLAFVSSDGPERSSQTSTVTGSGTSWSLVRRANTEAGTAEIWKAVLPSNASTGSATATPAAGGYDQSVTLSAFTGSLGIGASSASSAGTGAPSTSLTATAAGSWTWGVGNAGTARPGRRRLPVMAPSEWSTASRRTPCCGSRHVRPSGPLEGGQVSGDCLCKQVSFAQQPSPSRRTRPGSRRANRRPAPTRPGVCSGNRCGASTASDVRA